LHTARVAGQMLLDRWSIEPYHKPTPWYAVEFIKVRRR
jgi:hypothetical protein